MAVTVKLIAGLDKTLGLDENGIEYDEVDNVEDVLDRLCDEKPGNEEEIYEDLKDKKVSDSIMILLNGRNIVHLEEKDTEIHDGDKITMFPPVAGG
ncbi:MAG: ubiquitin-like small modifier protein 1 [Thermoplasmatota archaeon]